MELPKVEEIELQYINQWFSNLVDALNYDLAQIEVAVVALSQQLTTIDAAPTQYLADSLNKLVENINNGFEKIVAELRSLDNRLDALEGK